MALANCLGLSRDEVLEGVFAGTTGLSERCITEELAAPYTGVVGQAALARSAGEPSLSRQERLAWAGAEQLAAAARGACRRWGGARVGLILGTSTGGIAASERAYAALRQGADIPADYSFEKQHAFNGVADMLARKFGILGPSYVVSTACSSSAKALAAAGRLIATGVVDAVLVGGVDSLCLTTLLGFQSLGVVSPQVCRPFAAARDGITIGEGAAFMLLEREGGAAAFLLSVGESGDAHHMAHPHPEGRGAEQAMRQAIAGAGIEPAEVGYVNAHGTGTLLNDAIEAGAIARVFGRHPLVSSTKAATGHLLGACGVTEAAFCVAAIERGRVPGNGTARLSDGLDIEVSQGPRSCELDYALSNSLAFGGSNASVLLGSRRAVERRGSALVSQGPVGAGELGCELVDACAWHPDTPLEPARGPEGSLLSPRARGRASLLTQIFATLLERLCASGFDAASSPLVFGSAYGEMATTMQLLDVQAATGQSSPLRFQHSVHNTAAGILSIVTRNSGFSTSVAAGMDTTAMALLEAMVVLKHTGATELALLVADEASTSALASKKHRAFGAGFWLRRLERGQYARLRLQAPRRTRGADPIPIPGEADASLCHNPVADALRLVQAFRAAESGPIALGGADPAAPDGSRWWVALERARA